MNSLAAVQQWMQRAILAEDGVCAAGGTVAQVVLPSATLAPAQRLAIYADMYVLRLEECLTEDFPALRFALGADRFARTCRDYVRAFPSTHWSLNALGARLPEFLAAHATPFLAELARLEHAIQQVFDAEDPAGRLTPMEIEALDPEQVASVRFATTPALRLLAFAHPVNAFYVGFREDAAPAAPAPERTWCAVYRKDERVWRANLDRAAFTILSGLARGEPLGAVLASCVEGGIATEDEIAARIGAWFREWTADGLLTSIRGE